MYKVHKHVSTREVSCLGFDAILLTARRVNTPCGDDYTVITHNTYIYTYTVYTLTNKSTSTVFR